MAVKGRKRRERIRKSIPSTSGVGFIAFYNGKEIAFARDFNVLINKPLVKDRIGHKSLIIKHNVPEGIIAVY